MKRIAGPHGKRKSRSPARTKKAPRRTLASAGGHQRGKSTTVVWKTGWDVGKLYAALADEAARSTRSYLKVLGHHTSHRQGWCRRCEALINLSNVVAPFIAELEEVEREFELAWREV